MNRELLLQHFDRISEAPEAIPRLRRFILDLAVRGKLVEQDSADEPASELLKRIQAEKERLGFTQRRNDAKKGKNGGDSRCDVAALRETAFDLPVGWEWVRLGEICSKTGSGSTPRGGKDAYLKAGVPFLRSQNVYDDGLRLHGVAYISDETHKQMQGTAVLPDDLLLNITGGSIGRCAHVSKAFTTGNINQHVAILRLALVELSAFTHTTVLSPYFQNQIFSSLTGAGREGLPKNKMDEIVVPFPPLAEQHRIVAKVDELMALCDQLEAERNQREAHRDKLVAASLQQLAEASPPPWRGRDRVGGKLAEHTLSEASPTPQPPPLGPRWSVKGGGALLEPVFLQNFPRLTTKPEHIKQLRQTILNLAVRGKLVEQDPNDEPAGELLKRIQADKERLVKEGKYRGSTAVKAISPDAVPFKIPSGWVCAQFGQIIISRDGERIPVSKEERNLRPKIYDYYGASGVIDKIDSFLFDKPLLLIGEDGANLINRSTPIAFIARGKYWVNNHAHVLDGISEEFLRYIELHINAIDLKRYVTGTAQPKMNQAKMNSIPIALPPLAEQHRIVAKVDQLMSLCDQLETQLTTTTADSRRLLETVLRDALAGDSNQNQTKKRNLL